MERLSAKEQREYLADLDYDQLQELFDRTEEKLEGLTDKTKRNLHNILSNRIQQRMRVMQDLYHQKLKRLSPDASVSSNVSAKIDPLSRLDLANADYDQLQEYLAEAELAKAASSNPKQYDRIIDKIIDGLEKHSADYHQRHFVKGYYKQPVGKDPDIKKIIQSAIEPSKERELELAAHLTSDPEYIRLTNELNKNNPTKIYQKMLKTRRVKNIHLRGGGPCADDFHNMQWNKDRKPGFYKCGWAHTCVVARDLTNSAYKESVPKLQGLLNDLTARVNTIARGLSKKQGSRLRNYYNRKVRDEYQMWIKTMKKSIAGHEHAEKKARSFRDWCRRVYDRSGVKHGTSAVDAAAKDLEMYSLKDLRLMARHFGIPENLPRKATAQQLAVKYF